MIPPNGNHQSHYSSSPGQASLPLSISPPPGLWDINQLGAPPNGHGPLGSRHSPHRTQDLDGSHLGNTHHGGLGGTHHGTLSGTHHGGLGSTQRGGTHYGGLSGTHLGSLGSTQRGSTHYGGLSGTHLGGLGSTQHGGTHLGGLGGTHFGGLGGPHLGNLRGSHIGDLGDFRSTNAATGHVSTGNTHYGGPDLATGNRSDPIPSNLNHQSGHGLPDGAASQCRQQQSSNRPGHAGPDQSTNEPQTSPSNTNQASNATDPARKQPKPRKPRKKRAEGPVETQSSTQADDPTANDLTIPVVPTQRETITRFLNDNNPPPPTPVAVQPTMAEFMNKTTAEIRKIAHDKSKRVMTAEDEAFFFKFYEQQQRELAAAAAKRHVSVGMVEDLLGRKQAVCDLSSWNNFQIKHGNLFRGKGKGVGGSTAMSELSAMWKAMTPEEQAAYDTENLVAGNEDQDVAGLRANSESLRQAEKRVEKWMNTWQKKAVHIAASNHCEIVIFAVSTHLCDYSFQTVRATPGAAEFVREITSTDGLRNYQSRLQAFLTGAQLNNISASLGKKRTQKRKPKAEVDTARSKLNELVDQATDGKKDSWSWQGCDDALGKLGYKVVFMPGHVSQADWIKSYSNSLRGTEAKLIIEDIDNGLIRVIQDQDALIGRTRIIKQKPQRHDSLQPGTTNQLSGEDGSAHRHLLPSKRKRQPPKPKQKLPRTRPAPKKQRKRVRAPSLTAEERALDSSFSEPSAVPKRRKTRQIVESDSDSRRLLDIVPLLCPARPTKARPIRSSHILFPHWANLAERARPSTPLLHSSKQELTLNILFLTLSAIEIAFSTYYLCCARLVQQRPARFDHPTSFIRTSIDRIVGSDLGPAHSGCSSHLTNSASGSPSAAHRQPTEALLTIPKVWLRALY
ncbi:hypothetical protein PtA15_6A47 [Puccinia triticina]|uniref:HMG box domain-containing protein n=1 Tax=Puccinia triticina TaxID=208348 RepID=A0ABY7CL79_9BASI|nr:uncharacterized protein PtA15_6A47 [Puccinia triticina]WAQ85419.1 hypothetical protein PtA15_6A47 [Puccinia triticina]